MAENKTLTVSYVPTDISAGDCLFISPDGKQRGLSGLKWYQRLYLTVDRKLRQWLKIEIYKLVCK